MIRRTIEERIKQRLGKGKAVVVLGPRQVGKTTLIQTILKNKDYLFLDCDDPIVRAQLQTPSYEELKTLTGAHKLVFIDEAQRVDGIGLTLKTLIDRFKNIQLLVSGSSSFSLSQEVHEPLTGRKWQYNLYPISWEELESSEGFLAAQQQLETRLIYGSYPDIINNPGDEQELLLNLTESYLYSDILSYADIRKPDSLQKLVQALAFQVGNEVSFNELSQLVGVDKNTISKYIDLLEKSFVVFELGSFSRNLRNEIKKGKKIYFYDIGVRNAVIGNFNPVELRMDIGAIWENFLVSERIKINEYHNRHARPFFWRTVAQQEVDYIEEVNGKLKAFEFKWNPRRKSKIPSSLERTYDPEFQVISRSNFRNFICV